MNVVYRISNRRVYGRTLSLGSLKVVRITLCIPLLAARNKGKTHQLTRKERNRPIKTGPRIKKKRVNNPREYLSIHKNIKYHRLNAGESGASENQTISRGFRFLFFYFFKLYLVVFFCQRIARFIRAARFIAPRLLEAGAGVLGRHRMRALKVKTDDTTGPSSESRVLLASLARRVKSRAFRAVHLPPLDPCAFFFSFVFISFRYVCALLFSSAFILPRERATFSYVVSSLTRFYCALFFFVLLLH